MQIEISGTRNKKIKAELLQAANFYASELLSTRMSNNITLEIYLKKSLDAQGYCSYIFEGNAPRFFEIELSKQYSLEETLQTLAHEFVHLKQYAKKQLADTSGPHCKWNKILYDAEYNSIEEHSKLPWEIEAYALEKILYNAYRIQFPNFENVKVIP